MHSHFQTLLTGSTLGYEKILYFRVLLHFCDPIFWSLLRGVHEVPPSSSPPPFLCASMNKVNHFLRFVQIKRFGSLKRKSYKYGNFLWLHKIRLDLNICCFFLSRFFSNLFEVAEPLMHSKNLCNPKLPTQPNFILLYQTMQQEPRSKKLQIFSPYLRVERKKAPKMAILYRIWT